MSNNSHNPISKLLDIDFPEVKKANWNTSFDLQTTADVCYAQPIFTDRILANTHVKLDMNQASFANPTVAPLYGRYRVKYTAFWAPDRLYIPPWRDGDKMKGDDYPYPILPLPTHGAKSDYDQKTGNNSPYVPYCSLLHHLGMYPAMTQSSDWSIGDYPTPSNALPLLAFWDIYRHYLVNVQEPYFPIRVRSFKEAARDNDLLTLVETPQDVMVSLANLDSFFKAVREDYNSGQYDITNAYNNFLNHPPFPLKSVFSNTVDHQSVNLSTDVSGTDFTLRNEYHYGMPIVPLLPDMFNSWVSNENVELERMQSKVTTSSNGSGGYEFTMDQWILASRIQNKVRKTIFKNSDFAEYIDVQYGIKPPTTLTKPMFLGAFVSDIVFNDVISSVQGEDVDGESPSMESNRNLGSRAGYGRGTDYEKRSFIEFTAQEPGTLIIIQSVLPEVFYYEGRDEVFDIQNFNEEFNPAFDGVGFTPLQRSTMNLTPSLRYSPAGTASEPNPLKYSIFNEAIGQQPYGMLHMAKVNKLSGQMAEYGSYLPYSLGRSFNHIRSIHEFLVESPVRGWYSSYPFPEMFTNIFASFMQDNFQFYINFDYLKYQPISKQFLAFNH